jgi:hypothetical protein
VGSADPEGSGWQNSLAAAAIGLMSRTKLGSMIPTAAHAAGPRDVRTKFANYGNSTITYGGATSPTPTRNPCNPTCGGNTGTDSAGPGLDPRLGGSQSNSYEKSSLGNDNVKSNAPIFNIPKNFDAKASTTRSSTGASMPLLHANIEHTTPTVTVHTSTPSVAQHVAVHVPTPTVHVTTPTVHVTVPTVHINIPVPHPTIRVPTVSDIRLKRDIVELGTLDNGLHLYRYRYLWSDTDYVGVMAQEVESVEPEAVVRGRDGYLRVDYGRLGLQLATWRDWLAHGESAIRAH